MNRPRRRRTPRTRSIGLAVSAGALATVLVLPAPAAGTRLSAAATPADLGRGAILAQVEGPDAGVDEDRPVPPRRDDAIGDEATTIGWLAATVASIALLGVIALIWLRLGRAAQRPGDPHREHGRVTGHRPG